MQCKSRVSHRWCARLLRRQTAHQSDFPRQYRKPDEAGIATFYGLRERLGPVELVPCRLQLSQKLSPPRASLVHGGVGDTSEVGGHFDFTADKYAHTVSAEPAGEPPHFGDDILPRPRFRLFAGECTDIV